MSRHSLLVAVILLRLGNLCQADDDAVDLEQVLVRWSEAAEKCESLDTRFSLFTYDRIFTNLNRREEGRYFFDDSKSRALQIGDRYAVVWQDGNTLSIEYDRKCYERISAELAAKLPQREAELMKQSTGWFHWLNLGFVHVGQRLSSCRGIIPYFLLDDAAAFREQFELTIQPHGEDILVKAIPKQQDQELYATLDFLFHPDDDLPYAVRETDTSGNSKVYLFYGTQINRLPEDCEELLNPDLTGFSERKMTKK